MKSMAGAHTQSTAGAVASHQSRGSSVLSATSPPAMSSSSWAAGSAPSVSTRWVGARIISTVSMDLHWYTSIVSMALRWYDAHCIEVAGQLPRHMVEHGVVMWYYCCKIYGTWSRTFDSMDHEVCSSNT